MDEGDKQAGSNSVLTDLDCDPPKDTDEEDNSKPRRSSNDTCNTDTVINSPNPNGIQEESCVESDNNPVKSDLGLTHSVESEVQEKETLSDNKLSESSEDVSAVVCGDSNTDNPVENVLVSLEKNDAVEKEYNVMSLGEGSEVDMSLTEENKDTLEIVPVESTESEMKSNNVDLRENKLPSNDPTTERDVELVSEEESKNISSTTDNPSIYSSEESVNKSHDFSKENITANPVVESTNQRLSFSTETTDEVNAIKPSEDTTNQEECKSDLKSAETSALEGDSEISPGIDEMDKTSTGNLSSADTESKGETSEENSQISNEKIQPSQVNSESKKDLSEQSDTSSSKTQETEKEVNNPSSEVNLSSEITDTEKEETLDQTDKNEISQKNLDTLSVESEKENLDVENKSNCVQDDSNQRITTRLSNEQEEALNKSEDDGNDVMETEMVNCNEIEQVDVSESETDLKGENRDEEMVGDSLETPADKSSEDHVGREDSGDTEKNAPLTDDEAINQTGDSEEETITGDTMSQSVKGKEDEDVCIIPDDMPPVLSILPQRKEDITLKEEEKDDLKVLKVTTTESLKPKTRAQDKKNQPGESKPRPVRNAAKLAGNKIRSLVENDLVFDEQALSGDLKNDTDFVENTDESAQMCVQCKEVKVCKFLILQNNITQYLCSEQCSTAFKTAQAEIRSAESSTIPFRKCSQCFSAITSDECRLFWETMDFCNEDCLGKYQFQLGSVCCNCKENVSSFSLGKYCVRFGYDIKQFCCSICLEEYKKGLKVCSYCQKDISTGGEGFLAAVGNKGQFKDFCTQSCMEKYDRLSSNQPIPETNEECAVCSNSKPVQVEVDLDNKTHKLCSEPCFAAFKFVNNITEGQCELCRKYFDRVKTPNYSLRLLFFDPTLHSFCSKICMNVYILANRKIVPCNWCKVKKYNFDMIKTLNPEGQLAMMCSLNCLMLYQTSINAVCSRPLKCDFCNKKFARAPLYQLAMSDATSRNFCSYNCVVSFQNNFQQQQFDEPTGPPFPTSGPKRLIPKRPKVDTCVPVISSVQSLATDPISPSPRLQISRGDVPQVSQSTQMTTPVPQVSQSTQMATPVPQVYQQIITKPAPVKQMKNKSVLCKPYSHTKGVSCRPHPCMKETQTDQSLNRKFLIPIPVPIYVPAPMHMFSTPFPVPVPFPLPIPVPIFIPTTRNSAKGIMKEIKKIQEKIPTDPFEAELLMMAEMVAGDKKQDPTDSESEDGNDADDNGDGTFSPENVDTSNTFGDDMLQMALKMASELEEPAVDMESVLTSNTITTSTQPAVDPNKALYASDTDDPDQVNVMAMNRNRKRSVRGSRNSSGGTPSKRGRRTSGSVDVPLLPPPEPVPPRTIEVEKPDANMCLKYTFGVNAWRHWVMQKNAELEKAALTNRKIKLFKPELLQLTADELNFSLCLFVKEVRKPNGTEYAPDTIYYLCLGIQQYLFENGRIDNIFTDSYYEKFTDCLDEVAKKFAALYNDSQYIVTRVEEEHLWESKQLGAHSPHVLLSTLMFFNTKHFNLVTVEEHMQLSFSHIMKHWKRNPNTPGVAKVPGSRNVLLRFYPPQSALEANSRKKKVYEQQENEENPLRCPVKLYEFYLSKCPESVKTRNDVFYLLPERSCVPDSPVWYSTMALGKEPLMKMLHRIKMVKEINIALLSS